jgi:hypothetical protein
MTLPRGEQGLDESVLDARRFALYHLDYLYCYSNCVE